MISAVPSVSSVHVELDGRLPSTAGSTDETTKMPTSQETSTSREEDLLPNLHPVIYPLPMLNLNLTLLCTVMKKEKS